MRRRRAATAQTRRATALALAHAMVRWAAALSRHRARLEPPHAKNPTPNPPGGAENGRKRGALLGELAPEQPDYFNCGIFPILLARCLHHGVRITRRWTREDLDEQRDLITLELLEGKLLSFTA